VDFAGSRTVGVLTKLDLMDRGTDATRLLCGDSVPLRHGYVGVINRSQEDINNKKSMGDSLRDANNFFANHSMYRHMPNMVGVEVLGNKLNRLLVDHIKECLPEVRQQLVFGLTDMKKELESYGQALTHESDKVR
tara:strand:- start:194 stop:598 length:405 start_codon:yes stop_codon:yes gene_type:complete